MSEEINHDRRRFLGPAAMMIAAAPLGIIGSAQAQSSKTTPVVLPTIKPGTKSSFTSINQIDAVRRAIWSSVSLADDHASLHNTQNGTLPTPRGVSYFTYTHPAAPSLSPVRSLHYFIPAIDEILRQPLPSGCLRYLESKIAQCE